MTVSPSPRSADIDPAGAAPAGGAEDWPALWELLRRACAGAPVAEGELRWTDAGWQPGPGWSAYSRAWFAVYKPLLDAARQGRACVVGQLGQSLDGCVATAEGDSYYVTGPQSLLHLHRLRALCEAVLVGAGTVAADDPQLTTRRVPGAQPTRVVLDPAGRLDAGARVLCDGQAPSLWLCDARHAGRLQAGLQAQGAAKVLGIEGLAAAPGDRAAGAVLSALAALGLRRVLVEGGGRTVSQFLAAGALDHLHLVTAPVLIGSGRPGLQLPAQGALRECPRPPARVLALGDDTLFDLDVRGLRPRAV